LNVRGSNAYERLDGLFAFAMALTSVLYANSTRVPPGEMRTFLEMRITVSNAAFAGFFMVAWIYCFRALDLYRLSSFGIFRKLLNVLNGCAVMTCALCLYLYASHTTSPTLRIGAIFFVASTCYELCRVVYGLWSATRDPRRVMILGSGRRAGKAWREIRTQCHSTVKLLGFVDDRPLSHMSPDIADRYLGGIDELNELLLRNVVDELLIAVPIKSCYDQAQRAFEIAEQVGVKVSYLYDMHETSMPRSAHREEHLFGELAPFHENYLSRQVFKRVLDICGSVVGLLLFSPLFVLISLAVKMTSSGPVFFAQERYGYRRRIFRMYKFRTMVKNAPQMMKSLEEYNEATGPVFKIRRDPRVTRLGRVLRASSLDELPQLMNVLLGDMSLVGPRPMSLRDVSLFSEAALMRRFTVKPGITGLWQVSGRSALSFEQWISLDLRYIDHWSLTLDFQILARTVSAVVKGTGAV
jgi:exopolysaccharide biosynthesis polyprenyl glycosylphosphotransferase